MYHVKLGLSSPEKKVTTGLGGNNAKGPQSCQQRIQLRNYVNGSSGISNSSGLPHRRGVVEANLLRGGGAAGC